MAVVLVVIYGIIIILVDKAGAVLGEEGELRGAARPAREPHHQRISLRVAARLEKPEEVLGSTVAELEITRMLLHARIADRGVLQCEAWCWPLLLQRELLSDVGLFNRRVDDELRTRRWKGACQECNNATFPRHGNSVSKGGP